MGALDYLSSSATSLTVAGNTGVSPFLTLLLLGIVEKSDPELLHMDGFIEKILSNWAGIGVLAVLTGLEFLGKCIPVVDEIIDSIEIFVVPVLSIFGSLGTLGLLDVANEEAAEEEAADGEGRRLNVGDSMLTFLKTALVIVGVFLSLAIHLFKMLIRFIGLTCCAGCCQPCITVVEVSFVLCGVLVSIFIQEIAIVICIFLFLAGGYAIKRKFIDKNMPERNSGEEGAAPAPAPSTTNNGSAAPGQSTTANNDVENQAQQNPPPSAPKETTNESSAVSDAPPASISPDFVKVEAVQSGDEEIVEIEAVPVDK